MPTLIASSISGTTGRSSTLWSGQRTAAYVSTLWRTVRVGGHVIVATFGPGGPTQCSGLPVNRYGPDDLEGQLEGFELRSDSIHVHTTPSGIPQPFLHAHLQRVS